MTAFPQLQENTVLDDLAKSTESEPHVIIYTDGACSGNPGPGGWGAVLLFHEVVQDIFGSEKNTTNNRMEMMAALKALKALPRGCKVDIYTDSMYLRDGLRTWIHSWKKNGWKTADKKPVKNQDLWMELDEIQNNHSVSWHWVRGHDGNEYNERADSLARSAAISASF